MTDDPHGTANIPVGTPVIGYNGQSLGKVHEVHPHYILVGEEGQHADLDIPVHAITGFDGGTLRVSVTRESSTLVDDQETAHNLLDEDHPAH
jgi:hypothetical protein